MTATDSGKKEAGGSSALKSLVYVSGQFGGNLPNLIFSGWVLYFYTNDAGRAQPLISMYIMGAALICGRIVDALADPLIGFWSDKTHTRIGRRRPFILIGAPLMVGSFILLFRPMFPAGSAALVVSTIVIMGLFWFFFTAVMGPYLSLMPELAETSKQRVGMTTYMAVAFLIANAYQGFIAARMVDANGWNIGYFNMALISGALSIVFLYVTGLGVREKYVAPAKTEAPEEKYSMFQAFAWTFKNKAFVVYIFSSVMQYLGFASLTASIPYIVTRLMGKTESFVGVVYAVSIPGFVISFFIINILTKKLGKVTLYKYCMLMLACVLPALFLIGRVDLPVSPTNAGLILIAILSFPIAGNMVLPMAILADVADYDEKLTGHRREAMYFGMQGFLQKAATAMSQGIQALLFGYFGYSAGNTLGINLLGPVAGFFGFLGFLVFLKFPLNDRPGAEAKG